MELIHIIRENPINGVTEMDIQKQYIEKYEKKGWVIAAEQRKTKSVEEKKGEKGKSGKLEKVQEMPPENKEVISDDNLF